MLNIQTSIRVTNDWNNTMCNPLNLFTSSLYQSEKESYDQFGTCIKQFSKGVAKDELKALADKQNKEYQRVASLATNNMVDINKNLDKQTKIITDNYNKTNENIKNTKESLNKLTEYVKPTDPNNKGKGLFDKINNFKQDVKDIFSNIKNYVNRN
jgi:ABC-type transporter Mla subunit MlaD